MKKNSRICKIGKACLPAMVALALLHAVSLEAASRSRAALAAEAKQFLEAYNATFQVLYTANYEAQWASVTDVTEEHTGQRIGAEKAQAAFLGGKWVIEKARALLKHEKELDPSDGPAASLRVVERRKLARNDSGHRQRTCAGGSTAGGHVGWI